MIPAFLKRDLRGRFISNREAFNQWEESLRWMPARDAAHQLERQLSRVARVVGDHHNPDLPGGGMRMIVMHGKRVPNEMGYEQALALLERRA